MKSRNLEMRQNFGKRPENSKSAGIAKCAETSNYAGSLEKRRDLEMRRHPIQKGRRLRPQVKRWKDRGCGAEGKRRKRRKSEWRNKRVKVDHGVEKSYVMITVMTKMLTITVMMMKIKMIVDDDIL